MQSAGMERVVLLRDLRENDVMPADFEAANPVVRCAVLCMPCYASCISLHHAAVEHCPALVVLASRPPPLGSNRTGPTAGGWRGNLLGPHPPKRLPLPHAVLVLHPCRTSMQSGLCSVEGTHLEIKI